MIVRTFVTLLYLAIVLVAVLLQLYIPAIAGYILIALLVWFVVSFFVYRFPVMSRRIGRAPARPSSAPISSSGAASEASTLGFCPYCATPIEPGTPVCPACGHRIPVW